MNKSIIQPNPVVFDLLRKLHISEFLRLIELEVCRDAGRCPEILFPRLAKILWTQGRRFFDIDDHTSALSETVIINNNLVNVQTFFCFCLFVWLVVSSSSNRMIPQAKRRLVIRQKMWYETRDRKRKFYKFLRWTDLYLKISKSLVISRTPKPNASVYTP